MDDIDEYFAQRYMHCKNLLEKGEKYENGIDLEDLLKIYYPFFIKIINQLEFIKK